MNLCTKSLLIVLNEATADQLAHLMEELCVYLGASAKIITAVASMTITPIADGAFAQQSECVEALEVAQGRLEDLDIVVSLEIIDTVSR